MKRVFHFFTVIAVLVLSSCTKDHIRGGGPKDTVTRNVANFTNVSGSGNSNVFITQGAEFKVEVKGYSNLLPYFETEVINNELQLGYRDNISVKNDNIEVFITMPFLTGVKLSGSGEIKTNGNFSGNTRFEAFIAGSGNIIIAQGSAKQFFASIAGSGSINAINMVAEKAEVHSTGSGNTEITATQELKVRISGSGNVYYKGSPQITTEIAGSGNVLPK